MANIKKIQIGDTVYDVIDATALHTDHFVAKDANTALNDGVTTTWSTYGTRKLILSGNTITLDMSQDAGGWASSFLALNDVKGTKVALGGYGDNSSGLNYFFMGNAYNDPHFKLTSSGIATFKNSVRLPSVSSADGSKTYTLNSSTGGQLALKSEVDTKMDAVDGVIYEEV